MRRGPVLTSRSFTGPPRSSGFRAAVRAPTRYGPAALQPAPPAHRPPRGRFRSALARGRPRFRAGPGRGGSRSADTQSSPALAALPVQDGSDRGRDTDLRAAVPNEP